MYKRQIYHYLDCKTPFDRLWISSLTERAIREGLAAIRPGSEYDDLYLSEMCIRDRTLSVRSTPADNSCMMAVLAPDKELAMSECTSTK